MTPRPDVVTCDLLVLAGGRGSRLGGRDKAALEIGGSSLLERLLAGVDLGGAVVVVGRTPLPPVTAGREVLQTLEDPPGGGPVAGIAAGLEALRQASGAARPVSPWVAVVAVDQPGAAPALRALREQVGNLDPGVEAIAHEDVQGHRQWLLALYRRAALEQAVEALPQTRDASVGRLVGGLAWQVAQVGAEHLGDVDTWADAQDWERRLARARMTQDHADLEG